MKNRFSDQERLEHVQNRVANSDKTGRLQAWPRQEKELPIVELSVDWVRFSTRNHRTRAEQQREAARSGNSRLFTDDPLGPAAQDAQYEILLGQADFELIREDLQERGQQDPAVVTAEGILINGNRRAAAMRSLLHDFAEVRHRSIRCFVLPQDASADEILLLETELQVARDFKQKYTWINEALLVDEHLQKNNREYGRVAKIMHRSPKEIREISQKLQQANQLVELSNGNRLLVDFEENDSAFNELAKHIRSKDPVESESVRSVYFLGTLAGVNYRDLRNLRRPDADEMVTRELAKDDELSAVLATAKDEAQGLALDDEHDPLDDALGSAQEPARLNGLLRLMARSSKEEPLALDNGSTVELEEVFRGIRGAVEKAAEEAYEEKKDLEDVLAPIKRLQEARGKIERAEAILPRAQAAPDWNRWLFGDVLAKVEQQLRELREAFDRG